MLFRSLEQQLDQLRGKDEAAVKAIESIVTEERQHHDQSASHITVGQFWPRVLSHSFSVHEGSHMGRHAILRRRFNEQVQR